VVEVVVVDVVVVVGGAVARVQAANISTIAAATTTLSLGVMLRIHRYWSRVFPCSKGVTCT
jgi:hypothetical protein